MPIKKTSARKMAKRPTRTATRKTAKTSSKSGMKAKKTNGRKSSAGAVKLVHSRSKTARQSYSQI